MSEIVAGGDDGPIRLSVGLQDLDDIIADLDQAFNCRCRSDGLQKPQPNG
jgi:O-acetylhomoserine/O-acetylserine sulfhydrylase-like pyridoxal-dependent enzyme